MHGNSHFAATALLLMLMEGMFGHNLLRFSWLWYAGFLVIAGRALPKVQAQHAPPATISPLFRYTKLVCRF